MKKLFIYFFLVLCVGLGLARAQSPSGSSVIKLDPGLDDVISGDAKLVLLKDDFGITEGPNWIQKGKTGFLVFTDIAANVIYKMTEDGKYSVLVDHAGYTGYSPWDVGMANNNGKDPKDPAYRTYWETGADGLSVDKEGRIIIAGYVGRDIVRIEKDGKRTVLADNYEGKKLGGPNDVVVKRDGSIYFSDTRGGVRGKGHDPKEELPPQGIYMIKDGKVSLVVSDLRSANGLAFSPDEKYLYVTDGPRLRRYDVQPDDTTTNGQLFIDMSADKTPGHPDGMRVDSKGDVYSAGPGGVWIITPDGKHIGTITGFTQLVTNLCFGDADFKTIYITDRASLYKIRANTSGNRVF